MSKQEIKVTTIRLPKETWLKLRRLQEAGKIQSIHQAVLDGLELIIKREGGK